MGAAETLRQLIDAGKSSKRLDELSSARVIGKVALQVHAVQQKAGAGKAIGPITPNAIEFEPSGEAKFTRTETSSFGYSSPEQLTGSGDRRSDVFSLGTILWEVLTYQRLFDAMNDAAVKIAVKDREITPPAEVNANVPAELSAICMRALARNPADRFQSLKSMAVEIEEFLSEAGYEDNDDKIAQHLEQMPKTLKIELPSITRSPGGTQPPPLSPTSLARPASASTPPADRPASSTQPPSILTAPPVAEAPKSGAKLAALLANAGGAPPPPLASASASATAVGVPAAPVPSDWSDNAKPAALTPPAPAPSPTASQSIAVATAPMVPMAPILPGQAGRLDRSTMLASVPPQVKVATNGAVVDAKHTESKPPAQIVDDKPKAVIVEEPAASAPQEAPPVVAPIAKAEAKKPDEPALEAKDVKKPDAPKAETKEPAVEVKTDAKRADDTGAKKRDKKPTGEQKAKKSTGEQKKRTGPNPVAAVSLGPGPRESKADVLAGWGWGTDKHNAIAPDGYAGDDEDFHAPPDSKKTLMYVIGGGVAFAALITIIALVAGGGSKPRKKSNKPVAAAQTTEARDALPAPTPSPTDTSAPAAGSATDTQGSAMASGSAVDPVAQKAAADQAAADKAASDKAAADQAAADKTAADKAAADQAAADKAAAEKAAAEQALNDKRTAAEKAAADKKAAEQAAADKKAQDKAAAAQALADKKAADKATAEEKARTLADKKAADKAAAEEKAQALAEKKAADKAVADQKAKELAEKRAADAAARKATADKLAAEKAAQAKTAAKTTTKQTRPTTTGTKATTTVAKADKVDVEGAYRQGLQLYARGDTAGALASLRTSLAANPNYAPTWRGLGLVFEKMGEKEQARAAYKRYLQLAPGASDTDQIKGRLERLGA